MKADEESLSGALSAAIAGDARAYRGFFDAVTPMLRGIVQAKAGGLSAEEREDILQEILMAIHAKKHTWRQDAPLRPWLFAIARYKIVDVFRKRGQRKFVDVDDFADVLAVEETDAGNSMDLETLVAKLKGKQAQVVRLIGMEEKSYADVAHELGMSENAVRVNFHRGLEKLRALGEVMVSENGADK